MKATLKGSPVIIFLWVGIFLTFCSNEAGSQVRKMSIKELVEESTAIVHGKCSQKQSFWNDRQDKIFTRVKIKTRENIKGNVGSEADIIVPGGRVGNIIYEVSEMPAFLEGEEVFLFLWQHPSGKNLVTGAQQGKLTVIKDRETGEKVLRGGPFRYAEDKKTLGKRATGQPAELRKVFLEGFIEEVKSYIKR